MQIAMIGEQILPLENLDDAYQDRGLFFGDGVYEVLRSYDGRLFGLAEHLERFNHSLKAIEINDIDIDVIRRRVERAYAESGIDNAKIYFHITRGAGIRQHFTEGLKGRFLLIITEIEDTTEIKKNGISVITVPDTRWKRCDIKTLNLLPNVLAKRAAAKKGCDEAIFVDENGFIVEGSSSAFFTICQSVLQIAPLSANILPSITRGFVLQVYKNVSLSLSVRPIKIAAAAQADELFIAVSSKDIVPVVRFNDVRTGDGRPGKFTKLLMDEFQNLVRRKIN